MTKNLLLSILFISYAVCTRAQQPVPAAYPAAMPVNFVRSWDASAPIQDASLITSKSVTDVSQTTQYFDGLGRRIQTVLKQGSPLQNDLVNSEVYDQFGRQQYQYLPFSANGTGGNTSINDGLFKLNPFQQDSAFSKAQYPLETYFYSQVKYENSPLNRVTSVYAPGNSWVGNSRGITKQYLISKAADSVQIWNIASAHGTRPVNSGTYAAGVLFKNLTTDEQGHQTVIYTNQLGQTILKKVQSANAPSTGHTGWLCTYYVYDTLQNLRFILSPQAVTLLQANGWDLTSASGFNIAQELCFHYEYDARHRMIIKKAPGAEEEWMVYDARDRLVLSQNATLRTGNKWLFIKYDSSNRPIITGFYVNTTYIYQSTMQDYLNSQNMALYENYQTATFPLYSLNQSFPAVAFSDVQTITYYDNYSWAGWYGDYGAKDNSYDSYFATPSNTVYPYPQSLMQYKNMTGLITGVWDVSGSGLLKAIYYDDHGRAIQSKYYNQSGKVDIITIQYDFVGKVLQTYLRHEKGAVNPQVHSVKTAYKYDPAGRLKSTWQNVDNVGDQLIDSIQYNELGQTRAKYLGNGLDSLIYDFNIRGWLTGINKQYVGGGNNHYFGQELSYDNVLSTVPGSTYTAAQYNGNIAGLTWKTKGDSTKRKYDFTYDNVSQLIGANFQQNTGSGGWSASVVNYTVGNVSYDANGNILSMQQQGFKWNGSSMIDSLTYRYSNSSNKLYRVVDGISYDSLSRLGDFNYRSRQDTVDYQYDNNGNLSVDNNKGMEISYNYLNQPTGIHMRGKGNIQYAYDASGNKLWKLVTDSLSKHTIKTMYITGFVYELRDTLTNPTGGQATLQYLSHSEGRWRWAQHFYTNGTSAYGWENDFFERDHLGNTRMVLTTQKDTASYTATMEAANRTTESQLFANIAASSYPRSLISGYPTDNTTTPNDSVARVNGSGQKAGPSLLLKVMSGDVVQMAVRSFYKSGTNNATNTSFNDVLNALANGLVNGANTAHGAVSNFTNSNSNVYMGLTSFLNTADPNTGASYPKAYLNWIFLDDQFNYVSSLSGAVQAASTTYPASTLNTVAPGSALNISKNGYLYIWVSNETQNWDVFFDNLSVQHQQGPLLEENHYYPFGLTMAALCDKALKKGYLENKYRYNGGNELQNKEFSDGSGLELYDAQHRMLDPQLGRFGQIDPLADAYSGGSTYSFAANNPVLMNDPNGLEPRSNYYQSSVAFPPANRNYHRRGAPDPMPENPDQKSTYFRSAIMDGVDASVAESIARIQTEMAQDWAENNTNSLGVSESLNQIISFLLAKVGDNGEADASFSSVQGDPSRIRIDYSYGLSDSHGNVLNTDVIGVLTINNGVNEGAFAPTVGADKFHFVYGPGDWQQAAVINLTLNIKTSWGRSGTIEIPYVLFFGLPKAIDQRVAAREAAIAVNTGGWFMKEIWMHEPEMPYVKVQELWIKNMDMIMRVNGGTVGRQSAKGYMSPIVDARYGK